MTIKRTETLVRESSTTNWLWLVLMAVLIGLTLTVLGVGALYLVATLDQVTTALNGGL